jgi:hypothetical protein
VCKGPTCTDALAGPATKRRTEPEESRGARKKSTVSGMADGQATAILRQEPDIHRESAIDARNNQLKARTLHDRPPGRTIPE